MAHYYKIDTFGKCDLVKSEDVYDVWWENNKIILEVNYVFYGILDTDIIKSHILGKLKETVTDINEINYYEIAYIPQIKFWSESFDLKDFQIKHSPKKIIDSVD